MQLLIIKLKSNFVILTGFSIKIARKVNHTRNILKIVRFTGLSSVRLIFISGNANAQKIIGRPIIIK